MAAFITPQQIDDFSTHGAVFLPGLLLIG